MNVDVYKNSKQLPAYNFYEILSTDDFRYLIKDFDEDEEDDYIELKNSEELSKIFDKILTDIRRVNFDDKDLKKGKENINLIALEHEKNSISYILELYEQYGEIELLKHLNEYGCKFDPLKPIPSQIDNCIKRVKYLTNKINITLAKRPKEEKTKDKPINIDVHKEAIYISLGLELNYIINPLTTSIKEWMIFKQALKIKSKQLKDVQAKYSSARRSKSVKSRKR